MSLNGKDPLRGGCSKNLAELGVVSGDLLWLIPSGPASREVEQSTTKMESCDSAARQVDQPSAQLESYNSAPGQVEQSAAKMESCSSAPAVLTSQVISSRFSELLTALYMAAPPHTPAEVVLVVADAVLISEGLIREENTTILANLAGTYRVKYSYLGKDCHLVMTTMGRALVMQGECWPSAVLYA